MSSIDKYVEEHAQNLDRRVRVTNSGGRIVGRINGQVVFNVADRYGYLNDNERAIIQRGVNNYLVQEREEAARRAEEEARRRREEEERRRRLEAERQSAIAQARTAIQNKKAEAERYFNSLTNPAVPTIVVPQEIKDVFDTSSLIASTKSEMEKNVREANDMLKNKKESTLRLLNSNLNSINNATTASARQIAQTTNNISFTADLSGFNKDNQKIIQNLNNVLRSCENVLKQLKEVDRKYHNQTTQSLIQRVRNIPIKTTKDLQKVVDMINSAIGAIADEADKAAIQASLNELSKANEGLMELKLSSDVEIGQVYEIPKFENEINVTKNTILGIREKLLSAEFTTASSAVLIQVQQYLESAELGEAVYQSGKEIVDQLEKISLEDERLKPAFDAFTRAKEDALLNGLDVDMEFDPVNSEAQLDAIAEQLAIKQIEDSKSEMWNRAVATKVLMNETGYDQIGAKEEEGMLVFIYARKDLQGVVMQVTVTAEGMRRRLIGVKMNGKETPIEAIKEAGRKLEAENEPATFLDNYNKLFPEAQMAEDYGLADDPGIEEVIENNGNYDLDEENKVNEYCTIMGQEEEATIVSTISTIVSAPAQRANINTVIANDNKKYQKRKAQAIKAKYQTKD